MPAPRKARLPAAARAAAQAARLRRMLRFERTLWQSADKLVVGIDEAGAGPLAGPVFAAAVVLRPGQGLREVDDSKKLSASTRSRLAAEIVAQAQCSAVAQASVHEIDRLNIRQACLLAMRRALLQLPALPGAALHLLIDAHRLVDVPWPQTALVGGDGRSQSIAAASILAKVARDTLMQAYGEQYPGYGFAAHKGYGTAAHLQSLARLGPTPIHRRSFAPVARLLQATAS